MQAMEEGLRGVFVADVADFKRFKGAQEVSTGSRMV
jgi:hypothetical protein